MLGKVKGNLEAFKSVKEGQEVIIERGE